MIVRGSVAAAATLPPRWRLREAGAKMKLTLLQLDALGAYQRSEALGLRFDELAKLRRVRALGITGQRLQPFTKLRSCHSSHQGITQFLQDVLGGAGGR